MAESLQDYKEMSYYREQVYNNKRAKDWTVEAG
jgi:hypothetical protein